MLIEKSFYNDLTSFSNFTVLPKNFGTLGNNFPKVSNYNMQQMLWIYHVLQDAHNALFQTKKLQLFSILTNMNLCLYGIIILLPL
jgi:hypothetical protein